MGFKQEPTAQIIEAMKTGLKSQTGEDVDGQLEDHYEKVFALPARSKVLRFTVDEIENWGEQRRKDLSKQINSKIELLENQLNATSEWFTVKGSNYQYTFVPIDYFP